MILPKCLFITLWGVFSGKGAGMGRQNHNIGRRGAFSARLIAAAALLGGSAVSAFAAAEQSSAADTISPRFYLCEHNVRLPVTYIQTAGGNFYAVLQAEGKLIAMARRAEPQAESADGKPAPAKYFYMALDGQDSYRWYPEGDSGRLGFVSAEGKDTEQPVYQACKIGKNG